MRRLGFVLLLTLLTALAVSAQEVTTEPTAEVTVDVNTPTPQMGATTAPDAAQTTPQATMEIEMSSEATAEMLTDERAHVRFAHFAPDAPAVLVRLNGDVPEEVAALEYPSLSDWLTFDAGTLSIEVVPTGDANAAAVIGPSDLSLSAGTWQTIAVIGTMGDSSLNAIVVQEVYDDPMPGTGGLTFLNALAGGPRVDLNRGDVVYFAGLDFPNTQGGTFFSTLMADSGLYDFRVSANDDPANTLAEAAQQELAENAYTFMALIGTPDAPELFVDVTDRSEVAIQLGLLPEPGNLLDALGPDDNLTGLETVLASSTLMDTLTAEDAEYTIFAPANFALDEVDMSGMTAEQVDQVLQSHIVEGKLTSRDLLNGEPITSLAGTPLAVTVEGNNIYVNGVQVIAVNIPASNGVIHMLNAVLPQGEMAQ